MTDKSYRDRQILSSAQSRGKLATLGAFFRLSGPGWLQSAITLGGGSLGGALYLGAIGGTSMLWVNLVAIAIGVVMLSAISYVTLSTGKRPYQAINETINPVLGIGWVGATILANMIFIIAQFSLCYDVAKSNFGLESAAQSALGWGETPVRFLFSAVLASVGLLIVWLSFRPGWASRIFDIVLKLLVGLIVVSFVLAIVYLARDKQLDWGAIGWGLIPNFGRWFSPSPALAELTGQLEEPLKVFWESQLVENQQRIMIGAAATAVGINMTFLLPYSMLARGWDKPFRGFARWDLLTGMAIPFVLVTLCITVASAHAFHSRLDASFASEDPEIFQQSPLMADGSDTVKLLQRRLTGQNPGLFAEFQILSSDDQDQQRVKRAGQRDLLIRSAAALPEAEKKLAVSLARPNTQQLSTTLTPFLGNRANLVFGLGAFGMGFSTIIVIMLINGYAFGEVFGRPEDNRVRLLGAALAAVAGFCWFLIWSSPSRTWLIILASNFAAILLPIAYLSFFLMLNNQELMQAERPTGKTRIIWNLLMLLGIAGAILSAVASVSRIEGVELRYFVFGGIVVFLALALLGFSARKTGSPSFNKKKK
jgi:Mn2+/Fe2+ NRAMP family transporter